jgi:CBS domain-containing protein
MPGSIATAVMRPVEPLDADELIAAAAARVIESGLPALPAVEQDESFAGVFGEREFMAALFPGYFESLGSTRMISRQMDETIERRLGCASEPIRRYLTTDQVVVEDEFSDAQLAELFLHHRVLIIPIAENGTIRGVVTRHDFFQGLLRRFLDRVGDDA